MSRSFVAVVVASNEDGLFCILPRSSVTKCATCAASGTCHMSRSFVAVVVASNEDGLFCILPRSSVTKCAWKNGKVVVTSVPVLYGSHAVTTAAWKTCRSCDDGQGLRVTPKKLLLYYSCPTSDNVGYVCSRPRHQMLFLKAPRHVTVTIVCAGLAVAVMMRPNR